MHKTLKLEATSKKIKNLLQQQEKFDTFVDEFNNERPHQAIDMKCPTEVYAKSPRPYKGLPDITYPGYDRAVLISNCGRICFNRMKISLSKVFANQPIGLKEVDSGIWQADFMSYNLGYFDIESKTFSPNEDPFQIRFDKRN